MQPLIHMQHATKEQAMPFLSAFNYFYEINEATADFFIQNTYPITLKKGEMLHKAGLICNNIYFITKGAVRGFVKDDNKDISVRNSNTINYFIPV